MGVTRQSVQCEECGERLKGPSHMRYVYREGLCPSCDTWMEAEFENGQLTGGHNVVEATKEMS